MSQDVPVPLPRRASSAGTGPTADVDSPETRRWLDTPSRTLLSPSPVARNLTPSPGADDPSNDDNHGPPDGAATAAAAPQSVLGRFWARNKGATLVAVSQLFGASMNMSARMLEREGGHMHPVQVLLLRQAGTTFFSLLYMWWNGGCGPLFGSKDIRWLLIIRGVVGFFGIYGMWHSMMYLPLADATVITFLAPGVAGIICWVVLREPFTRTERLATLVALVGVVFIAQPASFFSKPDDEADAPDDDGITTAERLTAIALSLMGVCGAGGAYATLRIIGKRAHPLISVNMFGMACVVLSSTALVAGPLLDVDQPALSWRWPNSPVAWGLLVALAVLGFVMQYLLTTGLQSDRSNRATSMIYTHMLFALAYDRWVFHHHMNLMSSLGCLLILGSAVAVMFLKSPPGAPPAARKRDDGDDLEGGRARVANDGDGDVVNERSPMLTSARGSSDVQPLPRL